MSKVGKTILIIVIGIILVGIGYVLGGRVFSWHNYKLWNRNYNESDHSKSFAYNAKYDDNYEKSETINTAGIKDFYLASKIAKVVIKISDDTDIISYKIKRLNPEYFNIKTDGKKISFEDNSPENFFERNGWNFFKKKINPQIYISLPKNMVFTNFDVTNGVGELYIDNIRAEHFQLLVGVGKTNIDDIKISKSVNIECGIGEVKFRNSDVRNMKISTGVGSFDFQGKVIGKTYISGGIGEVNLKIDGSSKDYNFDVNAGLGDININGKRAPIFLSRSETHHNLNSENIINIEGGIGSISIRFKDND